MQEEELQSQDQEKRDEGISEEEIDINLIQTFPASDPPSWTLGHEPHGNHTTESIEDASTDDSIGANNDRPIYKETAMVKVGLLVTLEAKPGRENDVAEFLRGGLAVVEEEPATVAWFAIQMSDSTFGIFDAFPDEPGRQAHLTGRVAAALMQKAGDLLSKPPTIEKVNVLAAKLPRAQTAAGS
jgi:quinol monooxygenase YgiN